MLKGEAGLLHPPPLPAAGGSCGFAARGVIGGIKPSAPGSRVVQVDPNVHFGRVIAPEHAPRGPFRLLERRHGLAEMVECVATPRKAPSRKFSSS